MGAREQYADSAAAAKSDWIAAAFGMRTAAGCDQVARRGRSGCGTSATAQGRLRARWRRSALAQPKGLPQRVQSTTIHDYTVINYSLKMSVPVCPACPAGRAELVLP
jgi:hypothetical protein